MNETTHSLQSPSLEELQTEYELYMYMKDGTELCRMIGLLTKGKVPEGIIYRTNNISTLEEKNLVLFIKIVTEEFKDSKDLKDIFKRGIKGKKKESAKGNHDVFNKFSDFSFVLTGLSKLSQAVKKKYDIPSFTSSGKPTQCNYEDENYMSNDVYEAADLGSRRCKTKYKDVVKVTTEERALDFAVSEMIEFNNRFLRDVLTELRGRELANARGNELLNREFFSTFKLHLLIDLHTKLKKRFEKVAYSYIEIADAFEEVQDDFLVYCETSAMTPLAMDFFADQMSENGDMRETVEEIEKNALAKATDPDNFKTIANLVQMIPSYVMRWPVVLEAIAKQALKENKKDIEREARRAKDIMEDMLKHMEQVTKDVQYITAMESFKKEIREFPPKADLHQFGILKKTLDSILFTTGHGGHLDPNKLTEHDLLIFDEYIVALELEFKDEYTKQSLFRAPQRVKGTEKMRRYEGGCFRLKKIDTITTQRVGDQSLLWAKKFHNAQLVPEDSFVISLSSSADVMDLERELKLLWDTSKKEIYKGSDHKGHKCFKYRSQGILRDCRARCGDCKQLLQGLLASGVRCEDCNKIFHRHCFSAEKNYKPELPDYIKDPIYHLFRKIDNLQMSDFHLEESNYEEVKERLNKRSEGTFVLAPSGDGKALMRIDDDDKVKAHEIQTIQINGEDLFYIEKGTSASTILGLVKKHRKSHHLFVPINCESEEDSDNDSVELDSDNEGPSTDAHQAYFWGDISAAEAAEKLQGQQPGTFLIRKNGGTFKLSWIDSNSKMKHSHITKDSNGRYSWTQQRTFPTLHELTSFYQGQTGRNSLGSPLKNVEAIQAIEENMTEEERAMRREDSGSGDPYSLKFFQGTMETEEAETTLLREKESSYILWNSVEGEFWVSYKKANTVQHIRIEKLGLNYRVNAGNVNFTETSLERAIDRLKSEKVFTTPATSARSSKKNSVNDPAALAQLKEHLEEAVLREDSGLGVSDANHEEEDERAHIPEGLSCLGTMNNKQAEKVLDNHPEGTWLLRYNQRGEVRISIKKITRVSHLKIYASTEGYYLNPRDNPAPLSDLINYLREELMLKSQIATLD